MFKTIVPLIGIGALGSTGDSLENNIAEMLPNYRSISLPNGGLNGGLNGENHKIIINKMKNNPNITISGISVQSNIPSRTVERIIAELKEYGIVKRIGSKKTGYWETKE